MVFLTGIHCTVKSRFNEWPPSAPFHSLNWDFTLNWDFLKWNFNLVTRFHSLNRDITLNWDSLNRDFTVCSWYGIPVAPASHPIPMLDLTVRRHSRTYLTYKRMYGWIYLLYIRMYMWVSISMPLIKLFLSTFIHMHIQVEANIFPPLFTLESNCMCVSVCVSVCLSRSSRRRLWIFIANGGRGYIYAHIHVRGEWVSEEGGLFIDHRSGSRKSIYFHTFREWINEKGYK